MRILFLNATLFFAFLMLTDPPTSPRQVRAQVEFGALASNAWFGWRRAIAAPAAPLHYIRP